jgi:hypothetical protein
MTSQRGRSGDEIERPVRAALSRAVDGSVLSSLLHAASSAGRPNVTATGHVVGACYFNTRYDMAYAVLGAATLWELAPGEAVRLRWSNGEETLTGMPVGPDEMIAVPPGCDLAA